MNKYTYVVDHGEDRPAVGAKTIVNGGKLVGVSFTDVFEKTEEAKEILCSVLAEFELPKAAFSEIDRVINEYL